MRFSNEEMELMRRIGVKFDFSHMENFTDDDLFNAIDIVSEHLQIYGFDKDYEPTPDGEICEDILEKLSKI